MDDRVRHLETLGREPGRRNLGVWIGVEKGPR
jgi:hypothetical protein